MCFLAGVIGICDIHHITIYRRGENLIDNDFIHRMHTKVSDNSYENSIYVARQGCKSNQ